MFIETHGDTNITLTFIKSLNVKAYPCGRRRSEEKTEGGTTTGAYIPFDPEARLNTEANNRKHSSTNGYTQTYIRKWDNENLSLVLDGYLFDIKLDSNHNSENKFGSAIIGSINNYYTKQNINSSASDANKIYANIRIQEVPLYDGFTTYYTEVLRNQSSTTNPSTTLDLLVNDNVTNISDSNNYYFSGLSFSTEPLSLPDLSSRQRVVSLCILEKKEVEGKWQLYNPSLLIYHLIYLFLL
jgi:hypothetical protein